MRLSQKQLLPVIDSAKDIIYARSIVGNLLEKCQDISQKMENLVSSVIGAGTGSKSTLELKSQPKCLNKKYVLGLYFTI